MILTRHLAHLGSSWLSNMFVTQQQNTEQLTSWQPDHPIIVCLRLILISWLISLVQLSSALIVLQFATNCCFWLLMLLLLWGRKPLQRKRPFTSCCENGSSYGFQTKNLKFTDSRLDSSRLISTSKFVEQLVCSILLYLMMYFVLFFLATSKRPRLLVLSCIDCLLNCLVFQSKNISNEAAFWFQHQGRSAPVVGSCLTSQVWIGRGRFASCHIGQYQGISLGRAMIFFIFFAAGFGFFWGVPGSMPPYFSAFLLFCFSAFLLLCFSAFCFSCFSACLLLFFSASLLSLLLCFCAFSTSTYSTFSFLQSCVFAVLLPAPLLLCFLFLLPLCFCYFPVLYSLLFVS